MRGFGHHTDGNIAMTFAVIAPLILIGAGLGVDFQADIAQKQALQEAADTLALRGARELLLKNAASASIESLLHATAERQFASTVGAFELTPNVDTGNRAVEVEIAQPSRKSFFMSQFLPRRSSVVVNATAVAQGVTNVCVIALEESDNYAIRAGATAKLSATKCAILSNSSANLGVSVSGMAKLTANMICSSGGSDGGTQNYSPMPITDCPVYSDPLKERMAPTAGSCDFVDTVLGTPITSLTGARSALDAAKIAASDAAGGSTIPGYRIYDLEPGVYCGGIKINSAADVRLAPGVYVMKDGPLDVDLGARLYGENVGFYLTGDTSTFRFGFESMIHLTAPKTGLMAGLLFFEDRAAPLDRVHTILSANARTLLGTIYLPRGQLRVAALRPVADASAYTAIVVNKLQLNGSPTLTLNADYGATDIPVPAGVGPTGGQVYLRE